MKRALASLLFGVVGAGCAGTEFGGGLQGESGPVAWEVTNLPQTRSNDTGHDPRITWWFTLVLHNTSGSAIIFRQLTSGMVTPGGESFDGQGTQPYRTTFKAGDEMRLDQTFAFDCRDRDSGRAQSVFSQGVVWVLQFEGQDDQGRSVKTTAKIRLDSSSGPLLH
jgi:hypothetical protein